MLEKLFEYLEQETPVSLYCCIDNLKIRLGEIIVEDIIHIGERVQVYFNNEDYLMLNPDEYISKEEGKFIKDNGDYLQFVEEVDLC